MERRDEPPLEIFDEREQPRQFSLRQLFLWIVIIALMCVPLAYIVTFPGAVIGAMLGMVGMIALRVLGKITVVEMLCLTVVLCIWLAVFVPPITMPGKTSARRVQCQYNLNQVARALHLYHNEHGSFPPAYIADENGRPMHSWRVLILPYIDRLDLYAAYNFDEPWDGPNNRLLHDVVPRLFQCPSNQSVGNAQYHTSYLAIAGENTVWPGDESRTISSIANNDGTANTILVAEVANPGIHWMEPRDLNWESTSTLINQGPPGRCISSAHPGGANVATADGSVHFLHNDTPAKTVSALMTADGGETVELP